MRKFFVTAILLSGFAAAAWAQDSDGDSEETQPPEQAQSETETEAEDKPNPDQGSYVDAADDDFRPSEDIPADQSIPFPTDI